MQPDQQNQTDLSPADFSALFISHGAPSLYVNPTPAHRFLKELGSTLAKPRAILSVSAHFEAREPVVVADPAPETVYDFHGFAPELYTVIYPAPGAPELAADVAAAMSDAGLAPRILERRGFDHGVWVPLGLMYPGADIPVVQISINPHEDARYHYRLGKALAPLLGEGRLLVATGALTHNLASVFRPGVGIRPVDDTPEPWSETFGDWVAAHLDGTHEADLIDWLAKAPHARRNHPEAEHLMPLFVAIGAAGSRARQLHKSTEHGTIRMDTFGFDRAA